MTSISDIGAISQVEFQPKQVSRFTITKDLGKVDSDLKCAIQCKFQGSGQCDTFQLDEDSNCKIGILGDDATKGDINVYTYKDLNSQEITQPPSVTTANPTTVAPVTNPNPDPAGKVGTVCFQSFAKKTFWNAESLCSKKLPEILNEATFNEVKNLIETNFNGNGNSYPKNLWLGIEKNYDNQGSGLCQSMDCMVGKWRWRNSHTVLNADHLSFYSSVNVDYSHACLQIRINSREILSKVCWEWNKEVAIICQEGCSK